MSKRPKKTKAKAEEIPQPAEETAEAPEAATEAREEAADDAETVSGPDAAEAAAGEAPPGAAAGEAPSGAAAGEAPPGTAAGEAPSGAAADEGADKVSPWNLEPAEQVAVLETEVADLKDKLLRALAEAENVRRRTEREKLDAFKYAITGFARELLTVADNLRRALESVPEEGRKENEVMENLILGVEMTEREMLNAFERAGIELIEAKGKRFDHNLHQAMFEVEDKSVPAGTVVQEMETGYMLNGRLLRPAKVGVSKGGPKAKSEAAAAPEAAETPAKGQAAAYEKRVDAEKPADSGTQVDTKL